MNTIKKLEQNGYKIVKIYSGELLSCACGCRGKYYYNTDERNLRVYNAVGKLVEQFGDTIVIDSDKHSTTNEGFSAFLVDGGFDDTYPEINVEISRSSKPVTSGNSTSLKGYRIYYAK